MWGSLIFRPATVKGFRVQGLGLEGEGYGNCLQKLTAAQVGEQGDLENLLCNTYSVASRRHPKSESVRPQRQILDPKP